MKRLLTLLCAALCLAVPAFAEDFAQYGLDVPNFYLFDALCDADNTWYIYGTQLGSNPRDGVLLIQRNGEAAPQQHNLSEQTSGLRFDNWMRLMPDGLLAVAAYDNDTTYHMVLVDADGIVQRQIAMPESTLPAFVTSKGIFIARHDYGSNEKLEHVPKSSFLAFIDFDGNLLWSEQRPPFFPSKCIELADGGYIIGGGMFTKDEEWQIFVQRVNSAGEVLWHHVTALDTYQYLQNVVMDSTGVITAIGYTYKPALDAALTQEGAIVIQLESDGTLRFEREYTLGQTCLHFSAVQPLPEGVQVYGAGFSGNPMDGISYKLVLGDDGDIITQEEKTLWADCQYYGLCFQEDAQGRMYVLGQVYIRTAFPDDLYAMFAPYDNADENK